MGRLNHIFRLIFDFLGPFMSETNWDVMGYIILKAEPRVVIEGIEHHQG
jgi:hypothetical protein